MAEADDPPVSPFDYELEMRARNLSDEASEDPDKLLPAGALWWKAGNLVKAEQAFINAQRSDVLGAWGDLSHFWVATGGWRYAVERLQEQQAQHRNATFEIARIYARAGMRLEAEEYFQQSIELDVSGSAAAYGDYLVQINEPKAALEVLEASTQDDPDEFDVHVDALLELGRTSDVQRLFAEQFKEDTSNFGAYVDFLSDLGDGDYNAIAIAHAAFSRGEWDAAEVIADLEAEQDDPADTTSLLQTAWDEGCLTALGPLVKALDDQARSSEADHLLEAGAMGSHVELSYSLADRVLQRGDRDGALKWLSHAGEREHDRAAVKMAEFLKKTGSSDKVEPLLREAAGKGDRVAGFQLALHYQRTGLNDEADFAFSNAYGTDQLEFVKKPYLKFLLTNGRLDAAEMMLKQSIRSGSCEDRLELADLYDKIGRQEDRLDVLDAAVDTLVRAALPAAALAHAKHGNHELAAELFIRAADAGIPTFFLNAAEEYNAIGQTHLADHALVQAVCRGIDSAVRPCVEALVAHDAKDLAEKVLTDRARQDPYYWLEVARFRTEHGTFKGARTAYQRAVAFDKENIDEMVEFLAQQSQGPDTLEL